MGLKTAEPVVIGSRIKIRGNVRGDEDIVLQGQVEGQITLEDHHLTVAETARVVGDVAAAELTLQGELAGTAAATERVQLDASARVLGDVRAERLVVADGARVAGRVKMHVDLPPELADRSHR